jgi:hypothetical protein
VVAELSCIDGQLLNHKLDAVCSLASRDGCVGTVPRLCAGQYGARIRAGPKVYHLSKTTRPALRPTHRALAFFLGFWAFGYSPPSVPVLRVSGVESLLPLYAFIVLTGTTLPSRMCLLYSGQMLKQRSQHSM